MMKIGITGGIGSGKSFVCNILKDMGFPIYDCDSEAKRLMVENLHIIQRLTALIGDEAYLPDCTLNRKAVAQYLFNNQTHADNINMIVHPVVKEDFLNWASAQSSSLVFMESAILFESGFNVIVDRTVAVCAPLEIRIQRAMQRDHSTRELIEARIQRQLPEATLRALADYIIENNGKASVEEQIEKILHSFSYFL